MSIGTVISGSVAAIFGIAGLIGCYIIGFINLAWTTIMGILCVFILLVVVFKKRTRKEE